MMELLSREKTDVLFKVFNSIANVNIDAYMYMGSKKVIVEDKLSHYTHYFKHKLTREYLNMLEGDTNFVIDWYK